MTTKDLPYQVYEYFVWDEGWWRGASERPPKAVVRGGRQVPVQVVGRSLRPFSAELITNPEGKLLVRTFTEGWAPKKKKGKK